MDKPLLILDVDETLIYATKQRLEIEPDFTVFEYSVYRRPYLKQFINGLKMSYNIAIWSSAGNEYVETIISKLELQVDFEFVWGRNEATQKRKLNEYHETGNDSEMYYVKSLKKVKKKGYNIERILIVDDSPHKSKLNYGNAIYPKSYQGEQDDKELMYLTKYLESIKDLLNFRKVEKRNWRKEYDL